MSEKFDISADSTIEVDAEYLLGASVDDLLVDAKDKGFEIDISKGTKKQNIDSLRQSIDDFRKMIKNNEMTEGTVKSFFDNYLSLAINNPKCKEFKLELVKALLAEIQQRMDMSDYKKIKI